MELSKFIYEQKQRDKEKRKNQKGGETKEIWLSPNIAEHDLLTKAKKAQEFLAEGNKVKISLEFRGRMNLFKDQGELTLIKFADAVQEHGVPEYMPRNEGKRMFFMIRPVNKNGHKTTV